jgi:16S rRNA (guanine527-N7)-methyltransferase
VASAWLLRALEDSRDRGFLGPGDLGPQVEHALGFALAWEGSHRRPPTRLLDLGTGGGLPGLVLAERWHSPAVLLDATARRTAFLRDALERPGAPEGVEVVTERAEVAARSPGLEESVELVVARSFGPPAVTAECAARFASIGGWLIVAEPPDAQPAERWPEGPLAALGWAARGPQRHGAAFEVLEKVGPTPDRFPRAVGRPAKRPLF